MVSNGRSRREGTQLEAFDPETGGTTTVYLSHGRMQSVATRSMGHAKECGLIVPQVLQSPAAVFEGLKEDDDEDRRGAGWRCYCGIPDKAYYSDGSQRSPYPDQVFLVFINDEKVAYNWRWEKADLDNLELPKNHAQRFRKQLK